MRFFDKDAVQKTYKKQTTTVVVCNSPDHIHQYHKLIPCLNMKPESNIDFWMQKTALLRYV